MFYWTKTEDLKHTTKRKNSMGMFVVIVIIFLVTTPIVWSWVKGIDYMHKNHPDYKGNDIFGEWDDDDKNQIGNG